jgi:hypothetical protein
MRRAAQRNDRGRTRTFAGPRICAAIVDRLTFGGDVIGIGTGSYRLRQTRARAERQAVTPVG